MKIVIKTCAVMLMTGAAFSTLAADSKATATSSAAAAAEQPAVPPGAYTLDASHTSLVFRLDHLGFSRYTARFTKLDAKLQFDPANFTTSTLKVTIDAKSIDADGAPKGFMDSLRGPEWLDAAKYPQIVFTSTKVEKTGAKTMRITGTLALHGTTKPVVLNATYNGGYAGHPMDPNARIGFSAEGKFKRSDFGISYGIPAPGTTMGVGDDVVMQIETEFTGPALKKGAAH